MIDDFFWLAKNRLFGLDMIVRIERLPKRARSQHKRTRNEKTQHNTRSYGIIGPRGVAEDIIIIGFCCPPGLATNLE
jgi:hypothetical protein